MESIVRLVTHVTAIAVVALPRFLPNPLSEMIEIIGAFQIVQKAIRYDVYKLNYYASNKRVMKNQDGGFTDVQRLIRPSLGPRLPSI